MSKLPKHPFISTGATAACGWLWGTLGATGTVANCLSRNAVTTAIAPRLKVTKVITINSSVFFFLSCIISHQSTLPAMNYIDSSCCLGKPGNEPHSGRSRSRSSVPKCLSRSVTSPNSTRSATSGTVRNQPGWPAFHYRSRSRCPPNSGWNWKIEVSYRPTPG